MLNAWNEFNLQNLTLGLTFIKIVCKKKFELTSWDQYE